MSKPSANPLAPPAPAAPPTSVAGRLVGRFARATVAGITLLCFDWEFNVSTDFADGTAHGDYWEEPVQLRHSWTFRARGYCTSGGTGYASVGWSTAGDVAAITVTGYSVAGTSHTIVAGPAFAARGNFSAPMAMVTQEIELRGAGAPTTLG